MTDFLPTLFGYVRGQSFPIRKQMKYIDGSIDFIFNDNTYKIVGSFTSMPKKGEVRSFLKGSETYIRRGKIHNTTADPRNIANPNIVGIA